MVDSHGKAGRSPFQGRPFLYSQTVTVILHHFLDVDCLNVVTGGCVYAPLPYLDIRLNWNMPLDQAMLGIGLDIASVQIEWGPFDVVAEEQQVTNHSVLIPVLVVRHLGIGIESAALILVVVA